MQKLNFFWIKRTLHLLKKHLNLIGPRIILHATDSQEWSRTVGRKDFSNPGPVKNKPWQSCWPDHQVNLERQRTCQTLFPCLLGLECTQYINSWNQVEQGQRVWKLFPSERFLLVGLAAKGLGLCVRKIPIQRSGLNRGLRIWRRSKIATTGAGPFRSWSRGTTSKSRELFQKRSGRSKPESRSTWTWVWLWAQVSVHHWTILRLQRSGWCFWTRKCPNLPQTEPGVYYIAIYGI